MTVKYSIFTEISLHTIEGFLQDVDSKNLDDLQSTLKTLRFIVRILTDALNRITDMCEGEHRHRLESLIKLLFTCCRDIDLKLEMNERKKRLNALKCALKQLQGEEENKWNDQMRRKFKKQIKGKCKELIEKELDEQEREKLKSEMRRIWAERKERELEEQVKPGLEM